LLGGKGEVESREVTGVVTTRAVLNLIANKNSPIPIIIAKLIMLMIKGFTFFVDSRGGAGGVL
jgi:hypothetical protein